MIFLTTASLIGKATSEKSPELSCAEFCRYVAQYSGSKIRLWNYEATHSKLIIRTEPPRDLRIEPIDLYFSGLREVRCRNSWVLGPVVVVYDPVTELYTFSDDFGDVTIRSSGLGILLQDQYPTYYEYQ